MTLPVPGGILAALNGGGMDPTTLMALAAAAKGAGGPPAPGAAIAPAAIEPPTMATNAAMPAPQPLDHMAGPDLAAVADQLPQADIPQRKGILGRMGDTLHDPNFRAEALRFAMGAFKGGPAGGILAATDFADKRRAAAEDARRFDAEMGLKGRGLTNEERQTDITGRHYDRSDANVEHGQDLDYRAATRGQDVSERGNIRDNSTRLRTNHEDNATSRANTHESVTASVLNNTADNTTASNIATGNQQTDRDVATINAGAKNRLDPKDAMHGLGTLLPGMLNTDDAAGVAKALQAAPDLQAQLIDAYTNAWGDGSGNAADRARQAVAGILGQGASYTDDNSWLPMHGSPEITRGTPMESVGGGTHQQATAPVAPKPGDRVDGWTFKGGDPSDRKNWSK